MACIGRRACAQRIGKHISSGHYEVMEKPFTFYTESGTRTNFPYVIGNDTFSERTVRSQRRKPVSESVVITQYNFPYIQLPN